MDIRKLISDILEGKTRVLTFDNVLLGPDKDTTASVLSAINFARLTFASMGSNPALSNVLLSLCSGQMVEDAMAICHKWHNEIYLDVEDIYRAPLFGMSLNLVSMDDKSPGPDHIAMLLENSRTYRSSAAVLITRYPDVVTCLRLQRSTQEVFVLFNPRGNSGHQRLASLTLSTSLPDITQRVRDIFPQGKAHRAQLNLGWQANPLEKCTAYIFVPKTTDASRAGEEALIVTSLTLLTLRAELEELTRENGDLKKRKERLDRNAADLVVQLESEQAKTRHAQSTRPSIMKLDRASNDPGRAPPSTQPSRSKLGSVGSGALFDDDEIDPSIALAQQLQATFDSENNFLLRQKYELAQTAQRHYHCGVCLDDFPEDNVVRIDSCGHEICRDCVRGHTCTKIEERRFPVLCPVCTAESKKKNPGTISSALVQLLGVSEKQWETWVEMEIAQYSVLINCRKCHHSGFVDRHDLDTSPEIQCPFQGCDHIWCKNCQQTIEQGGPKHSCDGTSELDHLMKQQGWRYCPKCKTPIQKTQGCNHLYCTAPGCNTHFCYGCGKRMRQGLSGILPGEHCTC